MPNKTLEIRQKVCRRCNKLFETKHKHGKYCDNCKKEQIERDKK